MKLAYIGFNSRGLIVDIIYFYGQFACLAPPPPPPSPPQATVSPPRQPSPDIEQSTVNNEPEVSDVEHFCLQYMLPLLHYY